jgi:hypothetical protein
MSVTEGAPGGELRPADFCRQLLDALEASEGRRKRRKRNTTPDALGMDVKRELLERAAREDPAPDAFEEWLFARCLEAGHGSGPVRAMALTVLEEWRLVQETGSFREWLHEGAPSADAFQQDDTHGAG